jgi:hypothetical protein
LKKSEEGRRVKGGTGRFKGGGMKEGRHCT